MESISRLTFSENIEFVEILTNGSFRESQFCQFAAKTRMEKLSLWITHHHQHREVEETIASALLAQSLGAKVVVHGLLFPDSIEVCRSLNKRCDQVQITFQLGLGLNFNDSYPGLDFEPALSLSESVADMMSLNVSFLPEVYSVAKKPKGSLCSAGYNYFYIDPKGDMYQCRTYSMALSPSRLGSVLDTDFRVPTRAEKFGNCLSKLRCLCVEDFQHLQIAQSGRSWHRHHFVPTDLAEINQIPVLSSQAGRELGP